MRADESIHNVCGCPVEVEHLRYADTPSFASGLCLGTLLVIFLNVAAIFLFALAMFHFHAFNIAGFMMVSSVYGAAILTILVWANKTKTTNLAIGLVILAGLVPIALICTIVQS